MANQSSNIHNIPLSTANLNCTKYKCDISPYEGFIDQNSPFYGDVLSTFYTKTDSAPAQSTFITANGVIYFIGSDGCLYKRVNNTNTKLLHSNNFIIRDFNDSTLPSSTSPGYPVSVSFLSGSVSQQVSKNVDVWTSSNGQSYSKQTINITAPTNSIASGYYTYVTFSGMPYYGVPVSESGKYTNGVCVRLNIANPGTPQIRALYNNGTLQGFSVALDDASIGTLLCGLGTADPDKKVDYGTSDRLRFFLADGTLCSIKFTKTPTDAKFTIANNRYIILNYCEYFNCWDTLLDKPFHFANDYNNRVITYATSGTGSNQTSLNAIIGSSVANVSASSIYSNLSIATVPFISTQFATALDYALDTVSLGCYVDRAYSPDNQWIDVYRSKLRDSTYPMYVTSYNNINAQVVDSSLESTRYTNSFYGTPSIFATFTKSYLNKSIIQDWSYSYLQTYVNGTKSIFAYSADDELEHVDAAFVIQSMDFVIINNIIYRYFAESGQLQACVNIGNMDFVGNTPYSAIFWSETDKTFYVFTGDALLNPLLQANQVNSFIDSGYNSNTNSVYCVLSDGLYIMKESSLIRIKGNYKNVFPLNTGLALVDTSNKITYYSYNPISGYSKKPIEMQTMFYGAGDGVLSVNDCVYLRLFNDGTNPNGSVVLQCSTLTQEQMTTESKTFNITSNMWDPNSNTLLLRFQPKYQESVGFSLIIKSDFAIAELKISEKSIGVVNSRFNT